MQNWREMASKKLVSWRESGRVRRNLIIVNKSKKKQKFWFFFQCKIEFYFTHEHQNPDFHSWLPEVP